MGKNTFWGVKREMGGELLDTKNVENSFKEAFCKEKQQNGTKVCLFIVF